MGICQHARALRHRIPGCWVVVDWHTLGVSDKKSVLVKVGSAVGITRLAETEVVIGEPWDDMVTEGVIIR